MKCPECGAELKGVGYPKDVFQHLVCPNGCKPTLTWWIKKGLNVALYVSTSSIRDLIAVTSFPSIYERG